MTSTKIQWVRLPGRGRYESACKRFAIHGPEWTLATGRRWRLYDLARRNPYSPERPYTQLCRSLGQAKRVAQRIAQN